jgi:ABC-type nitrate/sulfonate/bicarbonate transport system permease component
MSPASRVGRQARQARQARQQWQAGPGRQALWIVVGAVAALGLWELLATVVFTSGTAIPPPTQVVHALWADRSVWRGHIWATLTPALRGWAIGTVVAVALATVAVALPFTERSILRVAVATYSLPIVAIGPVLIVSLSGDAPRIALAALAVVFTSLVATVGGLRAVPPSAYDVARALGGTSRTFFWKVRVRCALPGFFAGLGIGFPAAMIGSLVGEFLGAKQGLGVYMVAQVAELATARVWATAVVITTVTSVGFLVINLVGRRATRWVPPVAVTIAQPAHRRLSRRVLAAILTAALSMTILILVWVGYLDLLHVSRFVGKRPSVVWHFLTSSETATGRRAVFAALGRTGIDAGVGLLVGWSAAAMVACAFILSATVERVLMPIALALRTVPIIAVLPLLTLVFGRQLVGTIVIVSIIVFFPTLVLVVGGLRNVPSDLTAVSFAYDASPWKFLTKVRLPMAVPALFASLRIGCPGAVLGALLAEWLASGKGLGYLMLSSTTQSAYDQLWAATAVVTVAAVLAYAVTDTAERLALRRFGPA